MANSGVLSTILGWLPMYGDLRFSQLARASIDLGNREIIMPVEEIRLAHQFSCLPNQERVVSRLVAELFSHSNMHVRRIAVSASRRSRAFGTPGLIDAITERLSDPEPWVQYDAAWAIGEARYNTTEIKRRLSAIAANYSPSDDERVSNNPGDAAAQSRVKARAVLDDLMAIG